MRRLAPLLLVAALAAGCGGGRTYSTGDVQRAFNGLLHQSRTYPHEKVRPQFATVAAITELRIDEGFATPLEAYLGNGFEVLRFASTEDAAVAAQAFGTLELKLPFPTVATVRRAGNVLLVSPTTIPQANDALDRLH